MCLRMAGLCPRNVRKLDWLGPAEREEEFCLAREARPIPKFIYGGVFQLRNSHMAKGKKRKHTKLDFGFAGGVWVVFSFGDLSVRL